MFNTVHNDPAIIRTLMRGAVCIVNASRKFAGVVEESLSERKDGGPLWRCYTTVERIVRNYFHLMSAVVRKDREHGDNLMIAVRSARLRVRRTRCFATNHDIVDRRAFALRQ